MVNPDLLDKVLDWLDKIMMFPEDKQPQPSFNIALLEIEAFDKYAKSQVCPYCRKNGEFKIGKYERGNKGWELTVTCGCGASGIVNETGFRFQKVEQ